MHSAESESYTNFVKSEHLDILEFCCHMHGRENRSGITEKHVFDENVHDVFYMYLRKISGFLEASYNSSFDKLTQDHTLCRVEDFGLMNYLNIDGLIDVIIPISSTGEQFTIKFANLQAPIHFDRGSIIAIPKNHKNIYELSTDPGHGGWMWISRWKATGDIRSKDRPWTDRTMLDLIAQKYYKNGKTGAEAVRDAWQEISEGKAEEICRELGMSEVLGLIHAINTFSKELAKVDRLLAPREDRVMQEGLIWQNE